MRNPSRPTLTKLTLGLGLCCAAVAASAQTLVLDLVDANASPITVNAQGHILGYQQSWPCGNPTLCAPQTLPAVWRDGQALRLPTQVGLSAAPAALSPSGMAVGSLTDYGSTAKAVVWQFNGTSYGIQELGQLGLAQSAATAVDQQERVIGYALTPMVSTKPFVWTAASGMTDLSTQGYPASRPWRISPQGWVVADAHRYRLGDPSTVTSLPVPPTGYRAPTGQSLRINDSGDLAGVLLTTSSSSNLGGMHRWLDASQQWQALGEHCPCAMWASAAWKPMPPSWARGWVAPSWHKAPAANPRRCRSGSQRLTPRWVWFPRQDVMPKVVMWLPSPWAQ
ncbi:hypothetical protein [Ideonella paludis]|uniref:hypothetical protein n=1 Tax=Ideonella paludis TaxID=1233411 RepID=UPI00362F36EF